MTRIAAFSDVHGNLSALEAVRAAVAGLTRFRPLASEFIRHKIVRIPDAVAGRSRPSPPVAEAPVDTATTATSALTAKPAATRNLRVLNIEMPSLRNERLRAE